MTAAAQVYVYYDLSLYSASLGLNLLRWERVWTAALGPSIGYPKSGVKPHGNEPLVTRTPEGE